MWNHNLAYNSVEKSDVHRQLQNSRLMGTRSANAATSRLMACPICLDELTVPVVTECGHVFCEICIRTAIQKTKKACPQCRAPIKSHRTLRQDTACRQLISSGRQLLSDTRPGRMLDCEPDERPSHAPGSSSTGETWLCGVCTLSNVLAAGRCEACGARRPAPAVMGPCRSQFGESDTEPDEDSNGDSDEGIGFGAKRAKVCGKPTVQANCQRTSAPIRGAFTVGSRVEVDFDATWYAGVVTQARYAPVSYDIAFDDETTELYVMPHEMRAEVDASASASASACSTSTSTSASASSTSASSTSTSASICATAGAAASASSAVPTAPPPTAAGATVVRQAACAPSSHVRPPAKLPTGSPLLESEGQGHRRNVSARVSTEVSAHMSTEEAVERARAEGLPLVRASNASGYVTPEGFKPTPPFLANLCRFVRSSAHDSQLLKFAWRWLTVFESGP